LLFCFFSPFVYSENNANNPVKKPTEVKQEAPKEVKQEPPKIGNFALPSQQQPGALISFGQNTIDKKQARWYLFADDFIGVEKHFADIIPGILYGVTDNLSIFFNVPIAASYRENKNHSSGLEDVFLQLEYGFYAKQTSTFSDEATLVTHVTFPTGSTQKQPTTGFGSPSVFLGATFNRTYVDWFGFTSHGVVETTSHDGTKIGNQFLYQFGLGRNIKSVVSQWMLAWMVEVDGLYVQRNKIQGITDPDSGGNVIYITPSLWFSTKKLIIQLGVGAPITQHLFGEQKRDNYLLAANFGYNF
jgi:hypothetical protein